MVEQAGDGIVRNNIYAKWRTDKPAETGYSPELISVNVDPKYYDDFNNQPNYKAGCKTFLDYFEVHVAERPNDGYLGSRVKLNEKEFGDYEWLSYK